MIIVTKPVLVMNSTFWRMLLMFTLLAVSEKLCSWFCVFESSRVILDNVMLLFLNVCWISAVYWSRSRLRQNTMTHNRYITSYMYIFKQHCKDGIIFLTLEILRKSLRLIISSRCSVVHRELLLWQLLWKRHEINHHMCQRSQRRSHSCLQ